MSHVAMYIFGMLSGVGLTLCLAALAYEREIDGAPVDEKTEFL